MAAALRDRGIPALGIDIDVAAVQLARAVGAVLLRRVAALTGPTGRVLVEVEGPTARSALVELRLASGDDVSGPFRWARLAVQASGPWRRWRACVWGISGRRRDDGSSHCAQTDRPGAGEGRTASGPVPARLLAQPHPRTVADVGVRQRAPRRQSRWSSSPASCPTRRTTPSSEAATTALPGRCAGLLPVRLADGARVAVARTSEKGTAIPPSRVRCVVMCHSPGHVQHTHRGPRAAL